MRSIWPGIVYVLLSSSVMAAGELEQIEQLITDGKHAVALQQLDALTASDAPHARFLRARALAANGQVEEAIQLYQALIKQHPKLPEPYNNLAVLYVQQGQHEKAQQLLNKAMTTHPGYAAVYKNLSTLYVERARNAYGKALQLSEQAPILLESVPQLSLPVPKTVTRPRPQLTHNEAVNQPKPAMIFQADRKKTDKKSVENIPSIQPYVATGHEAAVKALHSWARAWSEQDADAYIRHYVDDYSTVGLSRQRWIQQRHERIGKPKRIKVTLSDIQVIATNDKQVRIRLKQKYASERYQDLSRKEFVLVEQDGAWKIMRERSLGFTKP